MRLLRQTNNPQLVQRLAPMQPGEAEAARRARSLWASLAQSFDTQPQPLLQVNTYCAASHALQWLCQSTLHSGKAGIHSCRAVTVSQGC